MLAQIRSIVVLLISITLIVVIHEFGHYATAHLFGVKTPVFSVGFGPALVKFKPQDTTFQLAALPLGGYVSMDMNQLEQKPYWQKMIIILAGIVNNILLAFFSLVLLFLTNRSVAIPVIGRIHPKSPAEKNGFRSGDRVVAINHEPVDHTNTVMRTIQRSPRKQLIFTIERNHEKLEIPVKLESRPLIGATIGYLGIEFVTDPKHSLGFMESIKNSWSATITFIKANAQLLVQLFKSKRSFNPVDLSMFVAKNIQTGLGFFLFFVAFTSIQVGLFNLLPIPMLDGGAAFEYTIEALLGHTLNAEQVAILHYILIILVVLIVLFITRKRK